MYRLVALAVAALVLLPAAPAVAAKPAPVLQLTVWPRYPRIGATANLTARLSGSAGPVRGTVQFRFDGRMIRGCARVPIRHGRAHCTAPRSFHARRTFVAAYSGSRIYRAVWVRRVAWS